ncbi:hypothetical protein EXE30_06890 [Acinetobacter halotolerans]|uniref:Type IV secretion system putative lipoprotein virB7 n=1 Tax=Acinetobacter halotolerans TaxID=1752076 RepID=A0A4Q6XA28_9GAMM|nr:lipoprotein [Acinetobacter halotolerans]RZF53696.1 hypothetical protein EXE30_06890 [Acinetobacter halotolerans]
MKKLISVAGLTVVLSACATAPVVPIGTNTYLISQTSAGGVFTNNSKLKSDVLLRANAFAESKGKVAIPVTSTAKSAIPGRMASFEYQFTLVDKNDPRATGGEIKSTPDNIEERRIVLKQE